MSKSSFSNRLLSLDALRGLDMFLLVGFEGIFRSLPELNENRFTLWAASQFYHPEWEGFTLYDLIFPLFIFMVGVSMPLSFSKRLSQDGGKRKLYKHILIRTLILTVLGIVLWQTPGGAHPVWGFYSVLYRIGFSYLFAAIILMNTTIRQQVYWIIGILIGYWLAMRFYPVPGYGMGDFSKEGNLANYVGNQVATHFSQKVRYLFSITLLTSIANALLGVLAGHWIISKKWSEIHKVKGLLLGGAALIVTGLLVHLDFPINKHLASTPFTLLTCGISAMLLGLFYWLIDVRGYTKWAFFFIVVGVNSITIYVADFLVKFRNVANVFAGAFDFGNADPFVLAITIAAVEWLLLYYLYRQKVFLKI